MTERETSKTSPAYRATRRKLLLGAAYGTLGATAAYKSAVAASLGSTGQATEDDIVDLAKQHAFYGDAEQAGIMTPPQRYVFYMTFDRRQSARIYRFCWRGGPARSRS